jgi:hypothetical protein
MCLVDFGSCPNCYWQRCSLVVLVYQFKPRWPILVHGSKMGAQHLWHGMIDNQFTFSKAFPVEFVLGSLYCALI